MRGAVITIIILIGGIFIVYYFNESCESWSLKHYRPLDFNGQIEKKFLDPDQRMQPVVILSDGRKYDLANIDIYNRIEIGDTLFKRSGSMKFYYVKNGDTTVFYQRCRKKDVTGRD